MRLLLSSTGEAIFGLDTKGHCNFCNPACLAALGYDSVEDLLGRNMHELIHHSWPDGSAYPQEECRINNAFRNGEAAHVEDEYLWRADGTGFPAEYRSHPIIRDKKVIGAVVTFIDITHRREAEEQLRQSQKTEAIGQLKAGVAHDFNNLLAVIMNHAEILQMQLEKDDPSVKSLIKAASRCADLTKKLLASRKQALCPQPIDVHSLITGMTDLLDHSLGENIEIQLPNPNYLWPAYADPNQLENAVLNLAINARDAMHQGGRISVGLEIFQIKTGQAPKSLELSPGDYVKIEVADNGAGMSPAVMKRAFDPFYTTKGVGEGSGLGLSMIHGFVRQSGGDVDIESRAGKSTKVQIYLPRSKKPAKPVQEHEETLVPKGHGKTILVLEDDAEVRNGIAKILRELGYSVRQANNGKAAFSELAANPNIDLLLCDIVLPDNMNGFEASHEARRKHPKLRVIFMTGYADQFVRKAEQLGDSVSPLTKPVRMADLAQRLREVLDHREETDLKRVTMH